MIIRWIHVPVVALLYPLLMPSPTLVSATALYKILVSSVGTIVGYVVAENMQKGRDMRSKGAQKALGIRCAAAFVVAILVSISLFLLLPAIREADGELPAYFVMLFVGSTSFSLAYELFTRTRR